MPNQLFASGFLMAAALFDVLPVRAQATQAPAPSSAATKAPAPPSAATKAPAAPRPSAPRAPAPAPPATTQAEQAAVGPQPQATTASFGDWVLRCRRTEGAKPNCEVAQTLQMQGQGPIAEIAFGYPPGKDATSGERMRVVVVVPNNVTLPGPLLMSVDEKDKAAELMFRRCLPAGCFADAEATDDILGRWRTQNERGRLAFKDGANRDIILPFSFRGLTQALDALSKQ